MNYEQIKDTDFIQPIFTHKMGRHSSKPSHAYPVVRLPLKFKSLAGRTAHVYQTQNNGKLAFLITVDEEVATKLPTSPEFENEDRVNDLEIRIKELERIIFNNNEIISPKKGKI